MATIMAHTGVAGTVTVPDSAVDEMQSLGWTVVASPSNPGPVATVRRRSGLMADRPLASAVEANSEYWASDYRGGTLFMAIAGAWVQAAPSAQDTGGIELAAAAPTAVAAKALTVNTWTRFPELTTTPFTVPSSRPLKIEAGELTVATIDGGFAPILVAAQMAIMMTRDAGATWKSVSQWVPPTVATGGGKASQWAPTLTARVPTGSAASNRIRAGDTVQAAVAIKVDVACTALVFVGDDLSGNVNSCQWPYISAVQV